MVVDVIRKTSLDAGSIPAGSTQNRHLSLTRRVSAVLPGPTGFDSLQVWFMEIMAADKRQSCKHAPAAAQSCRLSRLLGSVIPSFFALETTNVKI